MDSFENLPSHEAERRAYFESLPLATETIHPVSNYNSFINYFQEMAKKFGENPCVYYQDLDINREIVVKKLTYEQVDRISSNLACTLHPILADDSVVSLMENHSVHYYIFSLAIYKLRIPILFLSTRNSSQSTCHLLKQVGAQTFIYGESYSHIKKSVVEELGIKHLKMPDINIDEMIEHPLNADSDKLLDRTFTRKDLFKTLLIVHSSGTTGIPKAVRWSNQYLMYYSQVVHYTLMIRKQTEFLGDKNDISINLAPLCHTMGLFASYFPIVLGSSLFFFCQFPPSVDEVFKVMKSMDITRLVAPPSYITQMIHIMKETGDSQPFKKMRVVMSGGAPTSKNTDEFLLKNRINFISVHGMSECVGFLSSEFSLDRIDSNTFFFTEGSDDHAFMEPFDEDCHQLIIRGGSFYLATGVSNRENGDYATKDLFVKSKVKDDGYIYAGRADDTLIMSSGEKTNPLPIEDIIRTNPLVSNCTVIGEGRPCPSVLIELNFEVAKKFFLDHIFKSVQGTVRKSNTNAPRHSAILPEMIKVIPLDAKLPVSDKGTVVRKRAITQFEDGINEMYSDFLSQNDKRIKADRNNDKNAVNIRAKVLESIYRVLGSKTLLKNDVSLFKQGLTSILAIQLRNYISEDIHEVPQAFFYEQQTIENIINALEKITAYEFNPVPMANQFDYKSTTDILNKYLQRASEDLISQTEIVGVPSDNDEEHVVLLTGVTGSLGAYILLKLLDNPRVKKVYALVRSKEDTTLLDRIVDTFQERKYPVAQLLDNNRVKALPMQLEQKRLGLSNQLYEKLKSEVTIIQACGWLIDFNQPVSYFDTECISGLYNLVKFANRKEGSIPFHFISSISASGGIGNEIIREVPMPSDPKIASPIGYGQSKFIVEQLLQYLVEEKNMPCFIYRVGQLCGDRTTGLWNTTDMYPLTLIGGGSYLKKLPELNMTIDWLPLDIAGDAIVSIMLKNRKESACTKNSYIFHIVNPNDVSWSSLLDSLKKCGMKFDVVEPESWVKELALRQDNPAYKLLGFYQKIFVNGLRGSHKWEIQSTGTLFPDINNAPTINDIFPKCLGFWQSIGFYTN
ncbi:hypothetical protein BDF21DRAFT_388244 [Thamnidium elegans]|nr:hypothetical protein BDF21DRAFT_388244 [Thamnidium elegans]